MAEAGSLRLGLGAEVAAARGWGRDSRMLACGGCGAEIRLDPGVLATTCPFCGQNALREGTQGDENTLRPQRVAPFSVTRDTAHAAIRTWLGGKWWNRWMFPRELRHVGTERLLPVYAPWWVFSADGRGRYRCEVGHERQERRRSGKGWETVTVTDWRGTSGHVNDHFAHVTITASSRLPRPLLDELGPHGEEGLAAYSPEVIAGCAAYAFDRSLASAEPELRAHVHTALSRQAEDDARSRTGGTQVRAMHLEAHVDNVGWAYVLYPLWVTSFRFGYDAQPRAFHALVNGRSSKVVGHRPVRWGRVKFAIVTLIALAICLFIVPPLGLLCTFASVIGSIALWQSAKKAEG